MTSSQIIKDIILEGSNEDKIALYSFNKDTPIEKVLFKFKLFTQSNLIRYFKGKGAPFHDEMIRNTIRSYRGENFINLAFRGSAKTTLAKLFIVYVLLNDEEHSRKYIKILSRDIKNPRQIVTDIYNMCLELRHIYGDIFEKKGEEKKEETMISFTMKDGVKLTAGTVGQSQRGNIQDAFRPDWNIFDDIEDRESISSQVITEGIIARCDEAITGLSKGGSWLVLGNYISENGSIQWFLDKKNKIEMITPIIKDGKPTWEIFTMREIEQIKQDAEDFAGEYLCDPSRSDGKFFDIDRIEQDIKNARNPLLTKYGVKYWGFPILHHRYGVGADTSEGVGRDSSAHGVWDFRTGELVGTYHSNTIKPELFAYELARIGTEFNQCVVAPEMNNMSGGMVITTLKQNYENIYRHIDRTVATEKESQKLGWHTNSRTKNQMFMDFRKDYNDGLIKIYDIEVLKEMKMYSNTDLLETKSAITRHFDLLTAVVIGWQMKNVISDRNDIKVFTPDFGDDNQNNLTQNFIMS